MPGLPANTYKSWSITSVDGAVTLTAAILNDGTFYVNQGNEAFTQIHPSDLANAVSDMETTIAKMNPDAVCDQTLAIGTTGATLTCDLRLGHLALHHDPATEAYWQHTTVNG